MIVGLFLLTALSATGQTQGAALTRSSALPTSVHNALENTTNQYDYDFIAKEYVWSNKPLKSTAGKVCQTMKDHAFAETPYGINDDKDWNNCLNTQIRSIGYLRWLRNGGFKPTPKNRMNAQEYLKKTYTMGPWGSYSFTQLSDAVKAPTGQRIPSFFNSICRDPRCWLGRNMQQATPPGSLIRYPFCASFPRAGSTGPGR